MSVDPPNRYDRPGGGKEYRHPLTGEVFDSVTSALDIFDKGGLKIWSAMVAAEAAFEYLPQLVASILVPVCGNTFNRCYEKHGRQNRCERCPCGKCEKCVYRHLAWMHQAESGRRADEGTECHSAINHWIVSGGDVPSMRAEVQPYFATFLRFVEDYGLTPGPGGSWEQTEATLLNREHMYAGTSDAAIWIRPGRPLADELLAALGRTTPSLVRTDYKTREKPEERLYNDMPLQGVAYEHCPTVMLPNGEEHPAPSTAARMVLQLRPASYTFKPMVSGEDEFQVFLGLLRAYRWTLYKGGKRAFGFDAVLPAAVAYEEATDALLVGGQVRTIEDVDALGAVAEPPPDDDLDPWGEATASLPDEPWAGELPEPIPDDDDPWGPGTGSFAGQPQWGVNLDTPLADLPGALVEKAGLDTAGGPARKTAAKKAPAKTVTAKKTPAKKATGGVLAAPSTPPRMDRGNDRWPVGVPHTHLLDEQIPF